MAKHAKHAEYKRSDARRRMWLEHSGPSGSRPGVRRFLKRKCNKAVRRCGARLIHTELALAPDYHDHDVEFEHITVRQGPCEYDGYAAYFDPFYDQERDDWIEWTACADRS